MKDLTINPICLNITLKYGSIIFLRWVITTKYERREVAQNTGSYRCLLKHHRFHRVLRGMNTSEELSGGDRQTISFSLCCAQAQFSAEHLKFLHFGRSAALGCASSARRASVPPGAPLAAAARQLHQLFGEGMQHLITQLGGTGLVLPARSGSCAHSLR